MRERIVFKNNPKSYLAAALLGIAAGLLVAFFARLPGDDLWGLSLFSSKHYAAGINVFLYVYLMFYITGIFKRLAVEAVWLWQVDTILRGGVSCDNAETVRFQG